jgi:POT family proton-dependent oligopeptide transporter
LPSNRITDEYDRENEKDLDEKANATEANVHVLAAGSLNDDVETADEGEPTAYELETLRKVAAPMKWAAVAMCIIELAERASYYGSKG